MRVSNSLPVRIVCVPLVAVLLATGAAQGTSTQEALEAGLVDELCLTLVPILLGEGIRLFESLQSQTQLRFVSHHRLGQMLQITAVPVRPAG